MLCEIPDCDSPALGGAPLCAACSHAFRTALSSLHGGDSGTGLGADLDVAVTRQSRSGPGNMGRRSPETPVMFDERASEAIAVLHNTLSTWVRVLQDEVGGRPPADTLSGMARWLERFTGWIEGADYGAECADEVIAAVRNAEQAVDRPGPRLFAGACRTCGAACYVRPGTQVTHCRTCGSEHDAAAERTRMLHAAGDRLVTAAEAARALRGIGYEITDAMVRGYARRGHIRSDGTGSAGRPLYRLRDVLATASTPTGSAA